MTLSRLLSTASALTILYKVDAAAFHNAILRRTTTTSPSLSQPCSGSFVVSPQPFRSQISNKLLMSFNDDDGDDFDDDDDDIIDPNALGDWRQFRMNLADSGIATTTTAALDEGWIEEDNDIKDTDDDEVSLSISSDGEAEKRPKSVSKKNEELLMSQNKKLAKEYIAGVWAHEAPMPEVGGLVCRLPLEAEIYRNELRSDIGKMLRKYLDSDEYDSSSVKTPPSKEAEREQESGSVSFSPLAAKTVFWYRGAQNLVKKELEKITSSAQNGRIDPSQLSKESQELLQLYLDNQDTWQEVCLVVDRDEQVGKTTTLVLNRPMAFKVTEMLGRLVLFGANAAENDSQTEKLGRFLTAFGTDCAIYVGGPDDMGEPSVMVHGIKDLPGSKEISPGTGIFVGGIDAAVDGVLRGEYDSLDFRFFVGKHDYKDNELDGQILLGKYQPVACARALALKQCIQLPKPLWHEVLELCGGELKEISSLELMKRADLGIE